MIEYSHDRQTPIDTGIRSGIDWCIVSNLFLSGDEYIHETTTETTQIDRIRYVCDFSWCDVVRIYFLLS